MKNLAKADYKQLIELLIGGRIIDALDLSRFICDYYSKYESPVYPCDPELFKMTVLSNEGREVYCTQSLYWEKGVPFKAMGALSMELDFKVLVFATSWDGFSVVAKHLENLAAKCPLKIFAVKDKRDEDLDKGIILQLIDWIENDNVPAEWKEEVKCETIPR